MADIVSRRLRSLLSDYLSGNSVLREIENEFEAEQVPFRPIDGQNVGGARRTLLQGYYNGLDFSNPGDARRFLNILSIFMRQIERQLESGGSYDGDGRMEAMKRFEDQLGRDGFAYKEGTIASVSAAARLADAKAIAQTFDAHHMTDQIRRIEASIDTDPALAIGTAKELTESCFKTILVERGVVYATGDDLLQLGKKVFKNLKLVPDEIPDAAKGADTIKRVLSNLATIVQGLAEVRGLYGTGHGKEGRTKGITPRHARLVVGAATTLVTFLFETHQETKAAPPG
jgi:hypothetical protein